MKIRTDFVTNSSSSSFVALTIESKEFALILKKAEDILRDIFSEENDYFGGEIRISDSIFSFEQGDVQDGMSGYVPKRKAEIIPSLASLFSRGEVSSKSDLDEEECGELLPLLTELFEKADTLEGSFKRVEWLGKESYYGEYEEPCLSREYTWSEDAGESYKEIEEDFDF